MDPAGEELVTEGIPAVTLTVIVCLIQYVRAVMWSFQPPRSDRVNF